MAQKVSRIHVAEQETSQICGAEQATSRISGDEPRLRAALADIEDIEELLEYGAPPVVYRGGWPVDCASCLYALIPYPRAFAPKLQEEFPLCGEVRLTVLTRFGERAIRSFRTIDSFPHHYHYYR